MSGWKKLAAASAAGSETLNVEDVFSVDPNSNTYGTAYTITNNIDLAGKGGLIWSKCRTDDTTDHVLVDTESGLGSYVNSATFNAATTASNTITAVSGTGFTFGTNSQVNKTGDKRAIHWTFRKAKNFFDIQTYTGTGTAGLTISHDLGSVPGFIAIKRRDLGTYWNVYHRELGEGTFTTPEDYYMQLNTNDGVRADSSGTRWNNTAPTSTTITLGNDAGVNASGGEYVAYIFAHHDGTGTFGENGDQDIIRCGRLTGDNTMQDIDLGFEAQWFFTKRMNGSDEDWKVVDDIRGLTLNTDPFLSLNVEDSEGLTGRYQPDPDGFKMDDSSNVQIIYVAIRRPMVPVVEDSSDVFDVTAAGGGPPQWVTSFKADLAWQKYVSITLAPSILTRKSNNRSAPFTSGSSTTFGSEYRNWEYTNGFRNSTASAADFYGYFWRRAPGFFDLQSYVGSGYSGTNRNHNLGVVPEMMIGAPMYGSNLGVPILYHEGFDGVVSGYPAYSHYIEMSEYDAAKLNNQYWNAAPTSTQFTTGNVVSLNSANQKYCISLFATLDGVSKVGSYTGNGTNQNIDCGFSNGAKFIFIKAVSSSGYGLILDSERGINSGSNDPFWATQENGAQITSYDVVSPYSSGFNVVDSGLGTYGTNSNGTKYVFYAVAAP